MGKRPNVLWIFADQHRPQAMGCAGDPNVATPHLDRLANEGIRFANAYSNTPICSPFRASLYTGKYMTAHGVVSLHMPPHPGQRFLPQLLQEAGYRTSHMGKWHLSGGAAPTHYVSPYFRPGWDDWLGFECSNRPWDTRYSTGTFPNQLTLAGYQTDALTDLTVEWLHQRRHDDKPWFHVVSIEPPHAPHTAPEPYMAAYRDKPLALRPNVPEALARQAEFQQRLRGYYAQIANLDDNVGRMLQALEATGQLDETIVCYFSDHGDMMGSHGRLGKCRPEAESSQIPLLLRYPERIPAGTVAEALISGVDLMPTLLGMLGLPIPADVQGADLSAVVCGECERGADSVVLQFEKRFWAEEPEMTYRALVQGGWLYVHFLLQGPAQLYHLQEDPYQLVNVINDAAYANIRDRMDQALRTRLDAIGDGYYARAERLANGRERSR